MVSAMPGDATFDLSERHFGRFTRTAAENETAVASARAALAEAQGDEAIVDAEVSLGEALTVARREYEAIDVLGPAVSRARSEPTAPEALGWALLMLATAEQYADRPADAASHFEEALLIARQANDQSLEHYCLHHLGRFLVDQGQRGRARAAFVSCLVIRERVGDPRAVRTRAAIEALDAARESSPGHTAAATSAPPLTAFPVILRQWSESDADWYAASTRDPMIQRFTTEPADLSADEVRAAIRALLISDNPYAGLIITDATTGERLGNIAVDDHAEISYWLAASARGRGVATVALRCFSDWIFATTDASELWLRAHTANTASIAVAIRAGYERDPVRDDHRVIKGELWTRVAYRIAGQVGGGVT